MAVFDILNSCLFELGDSSHMNFTFPDSGDGTEWTFSTWFKRTGNFLTTMNIITAGADASNRTEILFTNTDTVKYRQYVAGSPVEEIQTDTYEVIDPTGWYHLVVAYDSDNGTAADRLIIYINGVRMSTTGSNIALARVSDLNTADDVTIGENHTASSTYLDSYLADTIFVGDSQELPTAFGKENNDSWEAIDAAPTYGANGFRLEYQTAAALGDDTSGNTNDFTTVNLATTDQYVDSPAHNHAVLNLMDGNANGIAVTQGNRQYFSNQSFLQNQKATMYLESGKWYWEVDALTLASANAICGITHHLNIASTSWPGFTEYGWGLENQSGSALRKWHNNSSTSIGDTIAWTTGVYFMCAYDADTGKLWFGLDGTWLDSGDPGAGTGEQFTVDQFPVAPTISVKNSNTLEFRSSLDQFEGVVPTGFNALSTANIEDPAIAKPSDYLDVVTYTGDGVAIGGGGQPITGLDFTPDVVWIKARDNTWEHVVTDSERGTTNSLATDNNGIEDTIAEALDSFDSGGFTVGSENSVNQNTTDYVAWCWRKAALAGLDISTWTGDASTGTAAHALGVAPEVIIAKRRDSAGTSWFVYNEKLLDTSGDPVSDPETDYMEMQNTAGVLDSPFVWNDTAPDASVINLGSDLDVNLATYVAYTFKTIPGFSRFSSYVGNGDIDQSFHWCGFRPKFLIFKRLGGTINAWGMKDNQREPNSQPINPRIDVNATTVEQASNTPIDFLSNGWRPRSTAAFVNGNNEEYIFWAFAEVPEKFASVGPDTSHTGSGGVAMQMALGDATGSNDAKHGDGAVAMQMALAGTAPNSAHHGNGGVAMTMALAATGSNLVHHGNAVVTAQMAVAGVGINAVHRGNGGVAMTMALAATGSNITHHGDGAVAAQMALAATGSNDTHHGDGAVAMQMALAAVGINNVHNGNGGVAMTMALAATGQTNANGLGGSPVFTPMTSDGQVDAGAVITGSPTFPLLTSNGQAFGGFILFTNPAKVANLPSLGATGNLTQSIAARGSPRLPQLQVTGQIEGPQLLNLPTMQVNGVICNGTVIRGTVVLPVISANGVISNPVTATVERTLPTLRSTGTMITGSVITGSPVLPGLQSLSLLDGENLISGTLTLPLLRTDPAQDPLAAGSQGDGTAILPFLRIEGTIVNASTLTQLTWALNTETFETTNYTNFNFVSLVSFAEQPYGVTDAGIFLLEGDDDDGTRIDAQFLTGIEDLGSENLKEVNTLYIGYRGGSLVLRLYPDGQVRVREYTIERISDPTGVKHARIKGSRGLRSRTWQLGLKNQDGTSFDIDSLGALIRILTRKTRKN